MARTDDVINVAGHRLSTGALEEVLASHPDVAECAVVGVFDALKGQSPLGFLVPEQGLFTRRRGGDHRLCGAGARPHRPRRRFQTRPGGGAPAKNPVRQDTARHDGQDRGRGRGSKAPATIEDMAVLDEIRAALRGIGFG